VRRGGRQAPRITSPAKRGNECIELIEGRTHPALHPDAIRSLQRFLAEKQLSPSDSWLGVLAVSFRSSLQSGRDASRPSGTGPSDARLFGADVSTSLRLSR